MITLELEFKSGDGGNSTDPRIFKQVARSPYGAIYRREWQDGRVEGFEVFWISVKKKGATVFKKVYEDDTEEYPSTGDFGRTAWFVMTEERARQILADIDKEATTVVEVKTLSVPVGEFTIGEFAAANGIEYPKASIYIKEEVEKGSIKFLREERRQAKGKMSRIFAKA